MSFTTQMCPREHVQAAAETYRNPNSSICQICLVLHLYMCNCDTLHVAVAQAASKQARLGREEFDVVSTSLPVSTGGKSQVDAEIRASVAAAERHTTAAAAQLEPASADQPDAKNPSGKAPTDPSGDSSRATASLPVDKHVVQNSGLLTSFLGDYGSDSDDGRPT